MVIDLEPCPFCGALGAFVRDDCPTMWVECRFCGAQGPFACGETRTAEAWNARAAEVADPIDRPTCHDVADFDRESFKCSRCGFRVLSIDGAPDAAKLVGTKGGVADFGFCPNCGAMVTDGDGCDVREL